MNNKVSSNNIKIATTTDIIKVKFFVIQIFVFLFGFDITVYII